MRDTETPLPTLILDEVCAWQWPQPPFVRRHVMALLDTSEPGCCIETPRGASVQGQLVRFDPEAGGLRFRIGPGGEPLTLSFAKFHRLTLTEPWPLARRAADAPVERVPTAAQERSYRIELAGGGQLSGRTLGHVRQPCGLFLFSPLDDGAAVQRVFVPQQVCAAVEFAKSAQERAVERWIATPDELFAALEAQKRARIKPIGQALLDLGLVTREVLAHALDVQGPDRDRPLGELLVAQGLLQRADLTTALAHKMGYPLVDLERFPIEKNATSKLSLRVMREHNALPLLLRGDELIVAVDDPQRIGQLQSLAALAELELVPVLAACGRIAMALTVLEAAQDHWAGNVPLQHEAGLRR